MLRQRYREAECLNPTTGFVYLITSKLQCTHSEPTLGTPSALNLLRLLQNWAPHHKYPTPSSPEPKKVRQGNWGGTREEVKATIHSFSSADPFLLLKHIFFPPSHRLLTVTHPAIKSMRVCKLSFQKWGKSSHRAQSPLHFYPVADAWNLSQLSSTKSTCK